MRRHPLARVKGLLVFHKAMAKSLAVARANGSTMTAISYRSALMANAQVLRRKLLYRRDGDRL